MDNSSFGTGIGNQDRFLRQIFAMMKADKGSVINKEKEIDNKSIYEMMAGDFICSAKTRSGYGCFQGIETASDLAKCMSRHSIRTFKRRQRISPLFFQCLKQLGLISPNFNIPKDSIPVRMLERILTKAGFQERLTGQKRF